jgi:hypothetical protein
MGKSNTLVVSAYPSYVYLACRIASFGSDSLTG